MGNGLSKSLVYLENSLNWMLKQENFNDRLAGAIQKGFDEIIADGSYQKLLESDVYTPWLREHLALSERRVIFVPNPDAVRGLDAVEPRYWIVPWSQFADGEITNGSQLCEFAALRGLCE